MAKKRSQVVGYTVPIRVGDVTIPIRGKTAKAARAKANRFRRNHLKNVAMGFTDATGFHPIRASHDCSSGRAGEGRSKGAAKVRTKRTVRKHLKKARPMH